MRSSSTIHACFAIFAGCLFSPIATPQEVPPSASGIEQATARVAELQRELLHERGLCLDDPCIQQKVAQVRSVLREYTLDELNRSDGDISRLSADLRSIAATQITGSRGRVAQVFSLKHPAGGLIVTVNVVLYGPLAMVEDAAIIQGFRKEGQRYVFAAETGDILWGVVLEEPILLQQPSGAQELRIMDYGGVPGASRNLIKAGIYGFDGYQFKELWRTPLREELNLTAQGNEIDVYFRERREKFGGDDFDLIHEILQLTASGVIEGGRTNLGPIATPPQTKKR